MGSIPENLTGHVDLICYDFDGVMTDNRVLVLQDGTEAVFVNRADGLAVRAFRHMGVAQIILSTERNPVVAARGAKLKIPVIQGQDDKKSVLRDYVAAQGYDLARTVFIGNDVNDRDVMGIVGYRIAPADAHPSIRAVADHVTKAVGGAGVIREFCETFFPGVL